MGATDRLNEQPVKRAIALSLSRLERTLGFGILPKEAQAALEKLQISANLQPKIGDSHKTAQVLVVPEVPWWRPDLELGEDLAEEIVRVLGYDRVPSSIPQWRPRHLVFDRTRAKRRRVRDVLYGAGLFEVMTYSFVSAEQLEAWLLRKDAHLRLKNPLSVEQAYLRSTLLPSHLAVLERNRAYVREAGGVGFYELSQVFERRAAGDQPDEPVRLAVTMQQPERVFAHVKGVLDALAWELNVPLRVRPARASEVYMPGRFGEVELDGKVIGGIGQINPVRLRALKTEDEVVYAELDLSPLLGAASVRRFAGLDRYPVTVRDVAVVLPADVTWQAVVDALSGMAVVFVDEYYGSGVPEGHKSLTLRLTVVHPDRTPTEAEATEAEAKVLRRLERTLGARPRN
jgi:phenylalanyl-tRNA synthetase beta chain